MLADGRPHAVEQLAERTGARRGELLTFLEKDPHLLEVGAGWVNVLRLADGVAFTHELSVVELETGVWRRGYCPPMTTLRCGRSRPRRGCP